MSSKPAFPWEKSSVVDVPVAAPNVEFSSDEISFEEWELLKLNDSENEYLSDQRNKQQAFERSLTKLVSNPRDATTTEDIESALSCISPDVDNLTWVMLGMAIKEELGDAGFSIWDSWSAGGTKYKPREMKTRWGSFGRRDGVTIGSLFHMAIEAGWQKNLPAVPQKREPDFELNGALTGHHPEQEITVLPKKDSAIKFPSRLFDELSGLPRSIFDFIQTSSMIKQPMLALPAALCAAGSIQGHRIRTEIDTRTNLYCLGLAPSGAGKDHARRVISRMMWDSGLTKMVIGDPKSGAGLKRGVKDNKGRALLMWDEIGRALKQIGSWKAGNHEKNILEVMMKIFTSSSSYMPPDSLANRDGKNIPEGIDQPCLSVYGTSVPENFYNAMSGADVIDGWLARILVFESTDYIITRREKVNVLQTPQELIDEVKRWELMQTDIGREGDVDDGIKPFTVVAEPDARKKLDDYDYDCRTRGFNTTCAPLWMRAAEHAEKIALISSNGQELTQANANFGIDLVDYCITYLQATVFDRVSSSDTEMQLKRIKRWMETNRSWVGHREVTKAFQDIPSRMRNDLMNTLIDAGDIETKDQGKAMKYKSISG